MRTSAKIERLHLEERAAWEIYSAISGQLQIAKWEDANFQEYLWRRGADCNMELLREKGIAPPKEED